jgi:PUA domain protein
MKKTQLSKAETQRLNQQIEALYGLKEFLGKKESIEMTDEPMVIFVNKKPLFFVLEGNPIPTLRFVLERQILKTVTVDMGAVRFVTQGADVMRPGIRHVDDGIEQNKIVAVVDERNRKPLAICRALHDAEVMRNLKTGKALQNLHYVGDSIWKAGEQ